jgi:hypothetical protein
MVTRLPGEVRERMGPSSVNGDSAQDAAPEQLSTPELLEQLRSDRLWLLQQIDAGRWPDLRLDLAALERELGQLLEQALERLGSPQP